MSAIGPRLIAAANGDKGWRGRLLREAAEALAQGMSTGTAKTAKPVEGEACQPGPKDAPAPCSEPISPPTQESDDG